MILAKLQLDEESELEFKVDIFGTAAPASDIRLVIEGSEYDVVCKGIYENGNLKVKVPKLKSVMPSGVHECRIECIIDGKIFTPLNESIEFEQLIEFGVHKTKVEAIKESVKIAPVKVTNTSVTTNKIQEAIDRGFDIAEYAGYNVLKKNNMYHGFVTESKLVMANDSYSTITELVDALGAK